uniref:hypothetical protein n=1 Tax=Candidatus Ichthyocystis sparus TaxID=1561004 RepID=UPI00159EC654
CFSGRGGWNDVGCKDFVSVLDTAGIPQVALSIMLAGSTVAKETSRILVFTRRGFWCTLRI